MNNKKLIILFISFVMGVGLVLLVENINSLKNIGGVKNE
jgi:hypothetical protein